MSWPQMIAVSGFGLALVVVVLAVRRGQAHHLLKTSAATPSADRRRSPTDHATSDVDEIVRRLALDPEFQAKTAGLIDRASIARHLEDIGPVVSPDKRAAANEPIPEEWTIRESTSDATAAWSPDGEEREPIERGRPAAEDVAAMRKEWDEDLWRKARRTSPTDDVPVSELIPEDVLSAMERLTRIVCRSVHELDQHLIGLDLGSWCDELLGYSDGLTTAKVGSQNMRAQLLMLRVRAHREAHPDFDVRSLLGPKDYVRYLDTTRQFLEQAEDLDDPDVQRAIERFCAALGIQVQEPSAEQTRHRARPFPVHDEMAIDDLSDQEAEAFMDTITGEKDR